MYGNVSRVLQTRKTIKIAWCFRKFHYNRDSNTNEHLSISLDFSAFWRQIIRALKTTSRKNCCELEGPLEMVGDRRVAPTSHRISWPETHGATCRMSWRGVVICSWNVPNQFVLEHTFLNGIIYMIEKQKSQYVGTMQHTRLLALFGFVVPCAIYCI